VSEGRVLDTLASMVKTLFAGVAVATLLVAASGCGSSGGDSPADGFVGLTQQAARAQAASLLRETYPQTDAQLAYVSQGFDPVSKRDAWDITFYDHPDGEFTGCHVYVWDGGGRADACEGARTP
jgi:hypothetical protein